MPSLLVERDGPIVVLTMNRPERRNALSLDMLVRLADAWDEIDADESIRVAILTGAGDAYCVGGDLQSGWMANEWTPESEEERRAAQNPALIGLGLLLSSWLRAPLIAAVNGACLGGGCEMLQQADIRVAEEQATFGLPEASRGLIPGAGSTMRLKRQIPYAIAMELLFGGRVLTAEEALRWGLVNYVVPPGQALAKAAELARDLCQRGPIAVRAVKASAIETGWIPEDAARPIEAQWTRMVTRSEDAKEGMRAFAEKRPPRFSGR